MANDEMRGKSRNLKGRLKDAWGALTGNKRLQGEGKVDRVAGSAQEKLGQARREAGDKLKDLGDKVK
jgi:uncharacterized protein YjbJ (UPF0337 family)